MKMPRQAVRNRFCLFVIDNYRDFSTNDEIELECVTTVFGLSELDSGGIKASAFGHAGLG